MSSENQQPGENKRYESDAKKLANKHMADPNHIITEEDLQNIQVGRTPPTDAPTRQGLAKEDDHIADVKSNNEEDITPGSQKMTPWDVID